MNCKILFKKNCYGEVEMYKQVNCNITQNGYGLDDSIVEFKEQMREAMSQLSSNQLIVMDIKVKNIPTRQEDGL